MTLEDADFVAPLRPYSCVTIAVALYAHRLGITLHYDPRPLTEQQATDLLETYRAAHPRLDYRSAVRLIES